MKTEQIIEEREDSVKMKMRFKRFLSGFMAVATLASVIIQPVAVSASELEPEEIPFEQQYAELKDVQDSLDPDEIVKANDIELSYGQEFDVEVDLSGIEGVDESKIKILFHEAKNETGTDFDTHTPDTYKAVYVVKTVSGHPAYRISRNITVKEPETEVQSERASESTVNVDDDTGDTEQSEEDSESHRETQNSESTADLESELTVSEALEQAESNGINLYAMNEGETVTFMVAAGNARSSQQVSVTRGAEYRYADYGYGTYLTYQYTVKFGNISATAYCVQPSKPGPGSGTYTINKVGDGKALAKVCYYGTRDKTVQKMSRDGLREKNLRSKKEKRITGREADEKKTAGHREQELDFGKVRKTHTAEETVEGVKEGKHRLQSRHAFLEQEEIAEAEEMENSEMSDDKAGGEKSPSVSRSRLRKESIRGHPERKFERDSEITEPDRQNRKKKMVTAYAAKEQKRYHEKSEVDEKSMEDFREEIKDKTKREQTLKEQKKSKSRLSFEDESKGMIPGSGMARKGATVVSETVSAYGQKKIREGTDDNAALDAANQMELAGESLARKSIYVRERLKEKRQRNNRLRESVLEETEKSRLQFGTSVSNEAKRAVQKEAEQKKQSALKKLLQKKRYQKQYQAAKQGKAVKDAVLVNAQRFTEKAKAAVKELVAQNRNILLSIGVLVLLFALMATSLSSCAALFQGSSNAIISTSYSSEDEDIYAAENAYVALENALNEQINQMKANHSDYDEFQFQIDEIGHNPYQLISYLTVKYGGFTYAEVADEIQEIFKEQYGLYTDSTRETVTEKKTVRVGESLGQVVTSGYCNCPICCGQWSGGPTASGAYPQANHTIAVDASNPFVPMGTHVIMNGVEYVVEDTGNFAQYGVQFDVFYGGHASASAHGHQTWEAYIADSNGSQEVEVTTTREVLTTRKWCLGISQQKVPSTENRK